MYWKLLSLDKQSISRIQNILWHLTGVQRVFGEKSRGRKGGREVKEGGRQGREGGRGDWFLQDFCMSIILVPFLLIRGLLIRIRLLCSLSIGTIIKGL